MRRERSLLPSGPRIWWASRWVSASSTNMEAGMTQPLRRSTSVRALRPASTTASRTSGFNDLGQALGSSLSYKAADDDTVKGFKVAAPDGEQTAYIESEFIENSNNNKNQALLFNSIAMQCDILDNLYDNWNVVHSLNNLQGARMAHGLEAQRRRERPYELIPHDPFAQEL